jgi:hypothetical protein
LPGPCGRGRTVRHAPGPESSPVPCTEGGAAPPGGLPSTQRKEGCFRLAGRPADLRDRLPEARAQAEKAVRDYSPTDPAPIADVTTPAAELLRRLPGVVKVEVLVACPKPARRIIHIRDWHTVPRDLYGADLLRCLARRHSLKRVLAEGLTPEGARGLSYNYLSGGDGYDYIWAATATTTSTAGPAGTRASTAGC